MIPNTTQTPNIIFNGLMAKMTDTELRVVMLVVRATLGWEEDKKTGMRKCEDWISYYQLKKKTGRGYTALAKAIDNCIKNGWIEARDKDGNLLDTKNKRIGKKIFYRLGKEILLKNDGNEIVVKETSSESEKVKETSSESEITESEITESEAYKNKHYTKINSLQKELASSEDDAVNGKIINDLIEKFKAINPSYERLFANKTQRGAMERLLKKLGRERLEQVLDILPAIFGKPYAPVITTPFALEQKLADLIAYTKSRSEIGGKVFTIKKPTQKDES